MPGRCEWCLFAMLAWRGYICPSWCHAAAQGRDSKRLTSTSPFLGLTIQLTLPQRQRIPLMVSACIHTRHTHPWPRWGWRSWVSQTWVSKYSSRSGWASPFRWWGGRGFLAGLLGSESSHCPHSPRCPCCDTSRRDLSKRRLRVMNVS